MAMMLSKRAMKTVEFMALDMARQTITECAALYGFSADEAMDRLGANTIRLRTEAKKVKVIEPKVVKYAFPLPFSGVIDSKCCQGVKANRGLYSQCSKACKTDSQFCGACSKQADKNASGEPDYGVISKRATEGESWRDPKGRAPISFKKLMKKLKLSEEQVLEEVHRLGISFDTENHFADEAAAESKRGRPKKAITSDTESDASPKKRGRPKKATKTLDVSPTEDLFASLVENAKFAAPQKPSDESDLSGSDSDSDTGSKKKSKLTDEEKAFAKEKAKEVKAQEKAEKKAARDTERLKMKAEKEAKEAEEKAEKAAAKEQAKAAKEAAKEAEKAKKEAEKAKKVKKTDTKTEPLADDVSVSEELEAEEPVVKVLKFEFKGVTYLRSADGTIYDKDTQEEIGMWNEKTQTIDECEEDSDSDDE